MGKSKVEQCLVLALQNQTFQTMKNLYTLPILSTILLTACYTNTEVGPPGPQGPQGPQGVPGESGYVFEWENVSFTAPDYQEILEYPSDFEGYDSDVALVYLLWGVDENTGLEIWRPLSQSLFTDNGLLIYNYDHTKYDVRLFLDAEFPLDWLGADYTDAWIVRVVVVPGSFWSSGRTGIPEYEELEEALGLPEFHPDTNGYTRRK